MLTFYDEAEIISRFVGWAKEREDIRALLMTSSRATATHATVDRFSDYDIILVTNDIMPYFSSRDWLANFGNVLALYRDPIMRDGDYETSGYVVQFEDGLKIDFTLWPPGVLERIASEPDLPDEFDAGYRVLIDKDNLTAQIKPPSYRGYMLSPPTEARYQETIENFFLDTTYVAKFLWRDDMIAAKHLLDHIIKQDYILPMLEWHFEIEHNWSVKPGLYGQRLKQWLRPDLWQKLERTYTGIGLQANWDALYHTVDLFRQAATEVGTELGFAYPYELDQRTMAYLEQVKALPPKY